MGSTVAEGGNAHRQPQSRACKADRKAVCELLEAVAATTSAHIACKCCQECTFGSHKD